MLDLAQKVRRYQIPSCSSPKSINRSPFEKWNDSTIRSALEFCERLPGKRGLFSDAIRSLRNLSAPVPSENFYRYEAHFNIDWVDPETENVIVAHGFEPDDFVELFPTCYTRNYTLSYDIAVGQPDEYGRDGIRRTCLELTQALSQHSGFFFVEAERFPSSNIRRYSTSKVQSDKMPLSAYRVEDIPCIEGQISAAGYNVYTKKCIDIHIKLAGIVVPRRDFDPDNSIETPNDLAAALSHLGMYRITSVSGNTIYTAQFADSEKARLFIERMDHFLAALGIAQSMIFEPCFLVLRNSYCGQYAPLCPLLD